MATAIKLLLYKPRADGALAMAVLKEALAQSKRRALTPARAQSFDEHLESSYSAMLSEHSMLLGAAEIIDVNERLLVKLRAMHVPNVRAMTDNEALRAIDDFYSALLAETQVLSVEADNQKTFGTALNTVGEFRYYRNAVTYDGKRLLLDARLMTLLQELLDKNNQYVGYDLLFDALWNEENGTHGYVERHSTTELKRRLADYIQKLRKELSRLDGKDHIENRRGAGYRFVA